MTESQPDDAGHDDNDQREDFGTCEQVLDEGGWLHLPAVDERQGTYVTKFKYFATLFRIKDNLNWKNILKNSLLGDLLLLFSHITNIIVMVF